MAATRSPERLKRLGWFDDVAPVTLDASDPVSAQAGMDAAGAIDVVYYLVHAIGQPGFRDADQAAATNLAVAARDAGVRVTGVRGRRGRLRRCERNGRQSRRKVGRSWLDR